MIKRKNYFDLPETGYLRLSDILTIIPISKSTWWKGVKAGRYPKPLKVGPKVTVWRAEEIRAFIDELENNQVA